MVRFTMQDNALSFALLLLESHCGKDLIFDRR